MTNDDTAVVAVALVVCYGRGEYGEAVLEEPVEVSVTLAKRPGGSAVSCDTDCPHASGGHGQRCRAAVHRDAPCPYSFDYPHVLRVSAEWQPPEAIAAEFRTVIASAKG
jgi:hypothetical protein